MYSYIRLELGLNYFNDTVSYFLKVQKSTLDPFKNRQQNLQLKQKKQKKKLHQREFGRTCPILLDIIVLSLPASSPDAEQPAAVK